MAKGFPLRLSSWLGLGACMCVLVALVVGCGAPDSRPEQRYELRGTILEVDQSRQRVTVKHDAIEGFMPAMSMPFRVKDTRFFEALEPGRAITADLVVAGKSSWLENIVVTTTPGPPSLPSLVEGSTEPTPGEPAPPFSLVDENGRTVSLHELRGKAVAMTFIYTRCPVPDYCPLMTDNFSQIARRLDANPQLASRTELVSISIDPEYDTPEVLRSYALKYAADGHGRVPANWTFLTGSPAAIRTVAQSYGLVYERDGDQVVHTLRTAIVAPDGRLVKVYRGNEWKPEEIVDDLTAAVE